MPRDEAGFTMIELMVALVILTLSVLLLNAATATFMHVVALDQRRAAAIQLVEGRIEEVQMHPDYAAIDTLYAGVESGLPTDFTRETKIVRFGGAGDTVDFKKVTVIVDGTGLLDPVSRTIVVAAP